MEHEVVVKPIQSQCPIDWSADFVRYMQQEPTDAEPPKENLDPPDD